MNTNSIEAEYNAIQARKAWTATYEVSFFCTFFSIFQLSSLLKSMEKVHSHYIN